MSEPGLHIRRAGAKDGPACAAIVDAWIDATPWMPRRFDLEALTKALAEGLPKREAYVVGDPVQGYLSMDPEAAHIWGFYVARPGAGLGRALLEQAKLGRDYLRLNTHHANARAQKFYAREGFAQIGAPRPGEDGIDEITMEWRR
ncbi:MAG: GNAT family N-acetyltransferase [Sulfitobacter sp.]